MIDYHVHSIFSDGKNTYQDYILEAERVGLNEIGFSDHICINYPKWAVKLSDFDQVDNEIKQLKLKSKNVNIRYGFEVDYIENREFEISNLLKKFSVDYIIGSVHYVNDWNFDINKKDFLKKDIDQFYKDYYSLVQKAAKSKLFDIIGHIDLAKKFNYFPSFNLTEVFNQTAIILKESDMVFELNTSGKDKDCKEFYPSDQFLKILYEHKVPVTLGSDSHSINHLGRYFNEAISKLKKIGYKQLSIFKNRKRRFIDL